MKISLPYSLRYMFKMDQVPVFGQWKFIFYKSYQSPSVRGNRKNIQEVSEYSSFSLNDIRQTNRQTF